jgi:hypothetical protein
MKLMLLVAAMLVWPQSEIPNRRNCAFRGFNYRCASFFENIEEGGWNELRRNGIHLIGDAAEQSTGVSLGGYRETAAPGLHVEIAKHFTL